MRNAILYVLLAFISFPSSAQNSTPVEYEYVTDDSTDAFRQDADMVNAFTGNFNPRNCRLTYDEANALGCAVTTATAGTRISPTSQIRELYNHAEAEVFIGFANRLKNVTQCQLTLVDQYLPRAGSEDGTNPVIQEQINEKVISKFTEHQQAFQNLRTEFNRLQMARNSAFHRDSRITMSEINTQQSQIRAAQEMLIREFPFANQDVVREQLLQFVRGGQEININNFRSVFSQGVSRYQGQLVSSKRRLDWALLPPDRVEAYEQTSRYSCFQRPSGSVGCTNGRPPANAQERNDLNYGRDVGPPGFTNEFKQELIAGDLTAMEEYLTSIGQGSPASDSFLCNVRSNHISGVNLRRGATIALELAGIVALSVAFPPAGAAGAAASTARGGAVIARGAGLSSRAERLLGITARGGRSVETSYAISMTPAIPRIIETCLGNESPIMARMASYQNTQCSPEASLQFTMEESRFAECATEVALTGGELVLAGGLARMARRTTGAGEGEAIVVTGVRAASREERRAIRSAYRSELGRIGRSDRDEVINTIAMLRRQGVDDARIRTTIRESLESCPVQR